MSTRKMTLLLIAIFSAALIWDSAYPVLAGFLFSDGNLPVGRIAGDGVGQHPAAPDAVSRGLDIPSLPLALTLVPLFPTNTPEPLFENDSDDSGDSAASRLPDEHAQTAD